MDSLAASQSAPIPSTSRFVDSGTVNAEPPASTSGERLVRRVRTLNNVFASLRDTARRHTQHEREWTIFGELIGEADARDTGGRHGLQRRSLRRPRTPPRPLSPFLLNGQYDPPQSPDSLVTIRADTTEPRSRFAFPNHLDSHVEDSDAMPSHQPTPISENSAASRSALSWTIRIATLDFLDRKDKDVLRCVLAYFIASLFTFVPAFSRMIASIRPGNSTMGPSPSAHMVATIAVYFSPAKTVGAMIEADIFCITAALFASVVCLCAVESFWLFDVQPGLEWLADTFILLWLGVVISLIAWAKLWMNKVSFNPACSMAVVTLSVVIIKEGGLETLLQVLFIILIGSAISNVVCFLVWPESAMTKLQCDIKKSLGSLSTLLRMIGHTFLAGHDQSVTEATLSDAVKGYQAVFTKLKSGLAEARSEWLDPRLVAAKYYEDAVESFTHLAQHMTGLHDGAKLKNELGLSMNGAEIKSDVFSMDSVDRDTTLAVFAKVQQDLAEPLTVLVRSCCAALDGASKMFNRTNHEQLSFGEMEEDINQALRYFVETSNRTVLDAYRRPGEHEVLETNSEHAKNEAIFNIYFFIFTLQEFGHETLTLLDSLRHVWDTERRLLRTTVLGSRTLGRIYYTAVSWVTPRDNPKLDIRQKVRRRMSTLLSKDFTSKTNMFPDLRPHASNTAQTPARESLPFSWRLKRTLWALGGLFKRPDVKYAVKTGMATAILAAPAFFDHTRPMYLEYRGEWALVSFFVVMGPTVGATNLLALQRVVGTIVAALVATLCFTVSRTNPILLAILGALFAVPCYWLVVYRPPQAASARAILLTYNLICLYSYNRRRQDVPVLDTAFKRSVTVIAGALWAFIVSRWWWPLEARRQLGESLSEFCQEMGWLYNRLVRTYSIPPGMLFPREMPRSPPSYEEYLPLMGHTGHPKGIEPDFSVLELHLQVKLLDLQTLLSQAENEPRLKGPFPVKLYRSILTSLQVILDKLHSMRCVTMREEWFSAVYRDFIMPVQKERREMVGNVILYFSTLSAAFRLKAPLPPYLPPAELSRIRLLQALRVLDAGHNSKDSRHLLYYAYASAMHGVIEELDILGRTLQDAFGVIGHSTAHFEALFDNSQLEELLTVSP